MRNAIKTLENSLYWQNYILSHSKDPKQKERVKRAIVMLQNEINRTRGTR
jgi:hypothetical protein